MKKLLITVSMVSMVTLAACSSNNDHMMTSNDTNINHTMINGNMSLSQRVAGYQSGYKLIMNEMHKEMSSVRATNNVSADFMMEMIPHHQAAIDMSKLIKKYTNSQRVVALADAIISEQENEIKQMKSEITKALAEKIETPNAKEYINGYNKIMNKMHSDMGKARNTCLVGVDYLREMIVHHQAAIDMSELALKFPVNDFVKKLANNIITSQKKEIALMHTLMTELENQNMKKK